MMSYLLAGMALALGQVGTDAPPASPTAIAAGAPNQTGVPMPVIPDALQVTTAGQNDAPATNGSADAPKDSSTGFFRTFWKANVDAFTDTKWPPTDEPEPPRRSMPGPWTSPPFPTQEYQGYPILGIPAERHDSYPLMKALDATPAGNFLNDCKIDIYGWVTVSGNWSTAQNSNSPASYWLVPNRLEMDQSVLRFERVLDSVQQDHMDWGFRSSNLYGIDYRYTTAGGWTSDQLLLNNRLYGFDPAELYLDWYIPGVAQGLILRFGRWIACPDIETQFAPDNYLASHSLLFTFDTYTQTGILATLMLNKQWIVQLGLNAGNDMAPWYQGAVPCGYAGVRWVSETNKDAFYTVLNQISSAEFSHFDVGGQPTGHDNFNYIVSTWEHNFTESGSIHTATEGYFMWQRNGELGGTPSLGPVQSFGGGGGDGVLLPGLSLAYGVLNYTEFAISNKDYICIRNEVWRDERGMRSGYPGTYTSNTIGLTHNFNSLLQIRPECGYYRNWDNDSFDLGTKKGIMIYGFDMTYRF